ncbi:hypothetical protein CN878_16895 [Ochrobactrum sp. 695/2009]|nr:hypothetical protein CN881_19390 [Ochrobactrum sp. 721/2009]PJT16707.1 hypothetical protein CN880_10255 [Ochrobactrum sp. 720/2009]PJT26529.1 hypothetical protein CN879_06220 [Ochrobactrum sp. 715/2009]PJT28655.1 hypothetical protein CN878_16895 [Ochrobactrum sp. 695/2009]PJT36049.1 hypothetical protein CN877_08665 [Ochrobactrum sp. 689/2009]
MASELKPCPFCGGTDLSSGGDDKFVGYSCKTCQATGPNHYGSRDWNTRSTPVAPVSPDATGKCGELETVAWNCTYPSYGHFTLKEHEAKQAIEDGASVEELVTRSQAVELLAERDETIRRQDIALRGALREVKRLKADNAAKDARVKELETEVAEATRRGEDQWAGWVKEEALRKALEAKLAAAEKALEFYAKQVSGCRKIGSDGDKFRASLDADGGATARAALGGKPS